MASPDQRTIHLRRERVYAFRLLLRGQPTDLPGVEGMQQGLWIFPRHPQSVTYQAGARNFVFATGLTDARADEQGVDPPTITVSGSFGEAGGYDARTHQGLDGRASQRALENLVRGYLKQVATDGRNRRALHQLEWHDVYKGESWVVTPALIPYGQEEAGRPSSEAYQLRLTALRRADSKLEAKDTLPGALLDGLSMCPLNPRCRYGGPFTRGCPYRSAK